MPGISGLEVLTRMRESDVPSDIVVITAHGSVEVAVDAIRKGASDFLLKPVDFDIIQSVVDRALERRQLERVNRALIDQTAGGFLAGASESMTRGNTPPGRQKCGTASCTRRGSTKARCEAL